MRHKEYVRSRPLLSFSIRDQDKSDHFFRVKFNVVVIPFSIHTPESTSFE